MREKTRYSKIKPDSPVMKQVDKVMTRFKKELGHINLEEVQFGWKFSDKSTYHGQTSRVSGRDKMFTDKKICMVLWRTSWKEKSPAWRLLLLYHELRHIYPPKKEGGDYRLVKHDVEDFSDLVEKYGARWQHAEKFLDNFKKE